MSFIEVEHVSKEYISEGKSFPALKDISISIEKGEIFGVIGLSGAGKSTFVRCLNYLEKPTSGVVRIDGTDLGELREVELREKRQKIGMIFQHFNLLMQRNVLDNVAFSLEVSGMKKKEARKKALELLKKVGLEDKKKAYPAQLSGGQKQRVAIARALATEPEIILCDEATRRILAILKDINKEYGITIVVITHAMSVVEEICERVAVLDSGELKEMGYVSRVFKNPHSKAAKRLIYDSERSVG